MADDLLSEDELSALLDSIDEDDGGGRKEKVILEYDFARPDKLNTDQVRSLQRINEGVAQEISNRLSRHLRIGLEVSLVSIGQLSFDVFRNSLADPTVIQIHEMPGRLHPMVLTVESKLALGLVDRLLGGSGQALPDIRPLTEVESTVLDNITRPFLDHLVEGWKSMDDLEFRLVDRESDPGFLQVIPGGEMVLAATFSVQAPGEIESGELCICIPFLALEEALGKLSSQARLADIRRSQTSADRAHLDKVVRDTQIGMRVDLGTATLTIGEVLGLAEGDVIVLDQGPADPIVAYVDGHCKALGRPGRLRRKTAFLVEEVTPDE